MTGTNPTDQTYRRLFAGLDEPVEPPHDLATRLRLRVLAEAELDAPVAPRPIAPPVALPDLGSPRRPYPTATAEPVSLAGPLPEAAVAPRPAPRPLADEIRKRRGQPWWLVAMEAAAGLLLLLGAAVVLIRLTVENERTAPRLGSSITAVAAPSSDPAVLWEREDPDLAGVSEIAFGDDAIVRMVQDEHKTGILWWERFEYETFLQSLDRQTGELNWQIPVVTFGEVYVTDAAVLFVNYPSEDGGAISLVGLNHADGSERWRTTLPASPNYASELSVREDIVFLTMYDGTVRALDLTDGTAVWTTKIGEPPSDDAMQFVAGSSLTLDGDRLLTLDATGGVIEIDPATGAITATRPSPVALPKFAYESRLFVTADRLVTMVTGTDEEFVENVQPPGIIRISAMDRATGGEVWSTELSGNTNVIAQAGDRLLISLFQEAESYTSSTIHVLDLGSGAEVWTQPPTGGFQQVSYTNAVTADGQFVYGTMSGEVIGIDVATGAERWRLKVGDHVILAPVVSGGIAITSDRQDHLVAIAIPENRP